MNQGKSEEKFDIAELKGLYKKLKEARKVLNWGEFSDLIDYDRTYVSRVVNGHEPITKEFSEQIRKKKADGTLNVPRETITVVSEAGTEIGKLHADNILLKASVKILGMTLAELMAANKGVSVTSQALDLEKTIAEEAKRMREKLHKK